MPSEERESLQRTKAGEQAFRKETLQWRRLAVVGMVMRRTFGQLIFGLTLGIPISLVGGRMMESQLYLVKSYDPWSLAVAIFVLAAAVAVAGFVPARRAASIDPMRALREQ